MKKFLFFSLFFLTVQLAFSQKKSAYKIYTSKGKKISYQKMIKKLSKNDIILFGEQHNNPISHWLQYETAADLNKIKPLILGAEMLEADNQDELDNYLSENINDVEFDSLARLWSNYDTDYAPTVDFCKKNKLPVVATNIPRRYAKMVYKSGFEILTTLSDEEKTWIAPLPIPFDSELPTYKEILKMMGDHGTPELVKAQAVKDATMSHFILKNYEPGKFFLHMNGAYHSDKYEGILWYLKKQNNLLRYGTISTVSQENVHKLEKEHLGRADFIICVDSNMTTTY